MIETSKNKAKRLSTTIAIALMLGLFASAKAQSVQALQSRQLPTRLEAGISVAATCNAALDFPTISSPGFQGQFRDSTFTLNCTHWMRVRLYVPDSLEGLYLIEQFVSRGETEFYIPNSQGNYEKSLAGRGAAPSQRSWNYPRYNSAKAYLVGGDTLTLFMHTKFHASYIKPYISIIPLTPKVENDAKNEYTAVMVILAGIALIAIYNLGIYFYSREQSYLFYALCFLMFAIYATTKNYTYLHWIVQPPIHIEYFLACTGAFATLFYWKFSLAYLSEGREILPQLYIKVEKLVKALMWACMAFSVLYIFANNSMKVADVANVLLLAGVGAVFFLGWKLHRKKLPTAKYYMLSNLIQIPFIVIYFSQGTDYSHHAMLISLIPSTVFTRLSLNIGLLVQAIGFSLALAARIQMMRNKIAEQKMAQEALERNRLLYIQRVIENKNRELEVAVQERTQSLQEANEELQLSQERLHELNQTKDRLFAIISHDLRGPVASFHGLSKVLQYRIKQNRPEAINEIMAQVDLSANSLGLLLDNLLQWAQSQLNGINYHTTAIDMCALAKEVQDMHASMAFAKNIATTIEIAPDAQFAWADRPSIATILRNVWGNALKFTENGTVSLFASVENAQIHLVIQDSGVGMPPEKLATIFQQIASTKGTQGEKGNGLGLHLCQVFAEKNNGRLSIESHLGQGTKVHLWLPLPPAAIEYSAYRE